MKTNRAALTVAEGLLPLLDVSILLLGLLLVLWNVAAARQVAQLEQKQMEQLPGINMVVLLRVHPDGTMTLRLPEQTAERIRTGEKLQESLEKARNRLSSKNPTEQEDRRPLVLVVYEDPWRMKSGQVAWLATLLRKAGCRYARVYP